MSRLGPASLRQVSTLVMTTSIFLTFLMFYPRTVAQTLTGIDAVRLLRGVTLLGISGVALLATLSRGELGWLRELLRGPVKWYSLYVTWALLSVGFSGDPMLSAAKVFELGVGLVVVAMVTNWSPTPQELDRIWKLFMAGIGLVVVGYFAISIALGMPLFSAVSGFPKYSGFGGGPDGANGMSQISAMLAIFGLSRAMATRAPGRKLAYWGLTAAALAVLLVSYSRASIGIFVMLLLLLLATSRRYVGLLLVSGAGVAMGLAIGPEVVQFLMRGQDLQTFLTLTGRINYLWVGGATVFLASPWIGHGYYYATTYLLPLALVDGYDVTLSNVDNTFLEVAMNLGLVGLLVFVALWLSVARQASRLLLKRASMWRVPMVREALLFLLATFVRSWVNPTIAYHHWNTLLFLLAAVVVWRAARGEEQQWQSLTPSPSRSFASLVI